MDSFNLVDAGLCSWVPDCSSTLAEIVRGSCSLLPLCLLGIIIDCVIENRRRKLTRGESCIQAAFGDNSMASVLHNFVH